MKKLILFLFVISSVSVNAQSITEGLLKSFSTKHVVTNPPIAKSTYLSGLKGLSVEAQVLKVLSRVNWVFGEHIEDKIDSFYKDYVGGSIEFGETNDFSGFTKITVPSEAWGPIDLYFKDRGSGVDIKAYITILRN